MVCWSWRWNRYWWLSTQSSFHGHDIIWFSISSRRIHTVVQKLLMRLLLQLEMYESFGFWYRRWFVITADDVLVICSTQSATFSFWKAFGSFWSLTDWLTDSGWRRTIQSRILVLMIQSHFDVHLFYIANHCLFTTDYYYYFFRNIILLILLWAVGILWQWLK